VYDGGGTTVTREPIMAQTSTTQPPLGGDAGTAGPHFGFPRRRAAVVLATALVLGVVAGFLAIAPGF
jgi:hypothetical protein